MFLLRFTLLLFLFLFATTIAASTRARAEAETAAVNVAANHGWNETELDCHMRMLAFRYAREQLQPWRPDGIFQQIHDALRLTDLCRYPPFPRIHKRVNDKKHHSTRNMSLNNTKPGTLLSICHSTDSYCIFVKPSTRNYYTNSNSADPNATTTHTTATLNDTIPDGSIFAPVHTIDDALAFARAFRSNSNKAKAKDKTNNPNRSIMIVFRQGIHTLDRTVHLDSRDSGLTLIGYPGEDVWLSGALSLDDVPWSHYHSSTTTQKGGTKVNDSSKPIFVANLTDFFLHHQSTTTTSLPKIASLFTSLPTHSRLIRARYPNSNPETAQWGYASPDRLLYSIPVYDNDNNAIVLEWQRPPPGIMPTFDYIDFSQRHQREMLASLNDGIVVPIKNDSTMDGYNIYSSGHGGICADLWGPESDSYWCGNASAGGWAEVDQECAAKTAQLQIPMGMMYNTSHPIGQRIARWSSSLSSEAKSGRRGGAIGGYIYAWHSQSWAMHMFAIRHASSDGVLLFEKGGGRQGGRNWCRCDQCTYAGPWCGQNHGNPKDQRLISGTWLIENVLDELDIPGEFYFDFETKLLYVYPNSTTVTGSTFSSPRDLRFAMLETLIRIDGGARDIRLENLKFRDTAATFLGNWSAPSGGDWSLHRGGAIFMENVNRITVQDCVFRRLDGNAIFLSGKTEKVQIRRNLFEWIGENAIATWGTTKGWDAVNRTQPFETLVEYNIFRELGIFQKQSSAWAQAKAALSTVRYNIMFNMPRAAINFNDGMGGGDAVMHNLIFNTCRESGDHGPINTWDRQPFLTTLQDGKTASFTPLVRTISNNFIFANYGASEGVDNDDGSSWYHVHHNVFYDSEGFKMDYGGHDSIFEENLVISYPATYGQQCIGFGTFNPGHGHIVRRNKCIIPRGDKPLAYLEECSSTTVTVEENSYYVPMNGTATYECGSVPGSILDINDIQRRFSLEIGSKTFPTPPIGTIRLWATELLWSSNFISEFDVESAVS